ncbi:MAG: ABC transporter ATP-binding protein [Candidatus Delongbacteria bacterium]|nr:ABC transporter ATP-binding protein [Candidatus Delongbacteria bacterium]
MLHHNNQQTGHRELPPTPAVGSAGSGAATSQPALLAEGVSRSWGDLPVLIDISLQVASGEIYGLVGPDGAGKTTLIRILVSLLLADSGRVLLHGHDTRLERQYVRRHVGYMPQRFSLYPDLTVEQNLRFFGDLYAVSREEQLERCNRLYRFSHLAEFRQRRAGHLSGGMKQKLALSCVLMHAPEVILLDEPTVGVDPVSRRELWDILHELRQEGTAILVSTPYMEEAEQCDRVGLINAGKFLAEDTPEQLVANLQVRILRLRTTDPWATWQRLLEAGLGLQVQLFGEGIHLTLAADENQVEVEARLRQAGISFQQLYPVKPGMEDLFLARLQQVEAVSSEVITDV